MVNTPFIYRDRATPRMDAHERAHLTAYLALLTRHADHRALIELRARRHDGGMDCTFHRPNDVQGIINRVQRERARTDVYVGVAPRVRRAGTKDAIDQLTTLWVDLDGPDAIACLAAFSPPPAILVQSGEGGHAYWLLDRPVAPALGERANARLAHACGGCPCWDAGRILRPPSTRNYRYDPPRPVRLLRLRAHERVRAEDVIARLPNSPGVERAIDRRWGAGGERRVGDDPLLAIDARMYVEALVGPVGPNEKARCRFHDDREPSLQVYPDGRGWYCFGCRRGGTIYDLAAELWGLGTRRGDFRELQRRLHERFLSGALRRPLQATDPRD